MSNPTPAAATAHQPAETGQNDQPRKTSWHRYKVVGGLVAAGLVVGAVLVLRQPTTPATAQPAQQPVQVLPTLLPRQDTWPPADPPPVRLTLDLGGRVAEIETSSWSGSILGLGLHRSIVTVTAGSAEASAMVFGGGSVIGPPADPADAGCFDMVSSDQRDGGPADPTLTASITDDGTATIQIRGPGSHPVQTISLALPGCPRETPPSATPTSPATGGSPVPSAAVPVLPQTHAGRPAPG